MVIFITVMQKITNFNVFINAVKLLIAINRIQNKGFCLHNICMCAY